MATYLEFHWETSYDRNLQTPFFCIEFASMDYKYEYYSAIYKGIQEQFLILESLSGSSSIKEIIELLCGCFEEGSNFDEEIKNLIGENVVQAICIKLNEIPVMISRFQHNPDVVFNTWKIACANSF